ncbi:MAG TPA: alpha-L-rhamnosidase C-terminal domain-containing protein [Terracidiphilus sp.]|nr:alpha-L-rhamnosidase C-terminal domain-containing protein [Terracidiphilus sp.]
MRIFFAALALLLTAPALAAQPAPAPAQPSPLPPDPPSRTWHASWITHPTAPLREPLVLHFRRTLTLPAVPSNYIVRVSADNRFILYVNGRRVGSGPSRGDLTHWRYERYDLAPFLHAGQNLIATTVWNFGVYAPIAQFSDRTAFLLESEADGDDSISTPNGWLVEADPGRTPLPRSTLTYLAYYAAGPGEKLDAAQTDWNWDSTTGSGHWVTPGDPMRDSAYPGTNRAHSASVTGDNPWALVPDILPHMEYMPTGPGKVVLTWDTQASYEPGLLNFAFPAHPITLFAKTHYRLLLDRRTLTTAYPALTVSGGKGSQIWITYSEALYDNHLHKGDRDALTYTDASGQQHPRRALGLRDEFLPDGGSHRTFQPLWWRTWRYLALDITTGSQPLILDSLTAHFTAYPFVQRATFTSPDADLAKIWKISWRTARLDAHETYMDTPYYEQLQYIGDTRIQALISYAVTGDDRLALQALQAFNDSRMPNGLTRSRYPSSLPQAIPTFSLLWVGMLHDYWMYRPNPAIVRESLPGVRGVLGWFAQYQQPDGLLNKLPWWSFIDWVSSGETPTYSRSGQSCITSLEYLGALRNAADLEHALGDPVFAARDRRRAAQVRSGLYRQCWSPSRSLLADNPDKTVFSQQANILAVLYDVIPAARQKAVLRKMLVIQPGTTPNGVLSASYYFRFYLARALRHAGLADDYLPSLRPWRNLLKLHFSTWPETPGVTRSDSHAWSAHPIYDLLTLVAGIQPASPGFHTVRIAPHLGSLPSLSATFPHPKGEIRVEYLRTAAGLRASITLPAGLSGSFVYAGRTRPLHPGLNRFISASSPSARYSKTRVGAYRNHGIQVDATIRER